MSMEIHYNAFISYRHHPDDIKVAVDIHRGLEHFKIPKVIKNRCSGDMRLFRDKEELPITSSLTSDIDRALQNSDFLIVICSPHTKESIWVQREIETFLRTHSRNQILTVLAAGEPYEVIPEILLHEDIVDPITGAVEHREYEPLSCDWRLKKRQANREELPRLAAALLGCGYDELCQRQRQYRLRRMITLFSAALGVSLALTAYFIHTSIQIQNANDDLHAANEQIQQANIQIQENLDQALQNQSEYLASAAVERLDAGDRLTAISLALAALPSQENPRPYVPEAERALSKALSAYEAKNKIVAQGAFSTDALVRQYIVSEDGGQLVILDARMVLTIWDTATFQKSCTIDSRLQSVEAIHFTASGNILIIGSDTVLCYQPDGVLLWQAEHCVDTAFLDDRSRILTIQNNYNDLLQYSVMEADSGEIIASIPIVHQEQNSMPAAFLQLENASNQPVLVRYFSGNTDFVFLLDLQTGALRKVTMMDTSFYGDNFSVECAALDTQGNVILMRGDGSGIFNGNYGTYQITSPARADLICYDAQTLEIKWQSEITSYVYSHIRTIRTIPNSNRLLIQSGNVLQIHDSTTGEKLTQCQLPAIPLHLTVEETESWGITQNGTHFQYNYAEDLCYVTPFTDSTLNSAIVNDGIFVHVPLECQVTIYRSMKDDGGIAYEGSVDSTPTECYTSGDYMLDYVGKNLYLYDADQKALLWQQEVGYRLQILGFSEDSSRLWILDDTLPSVAEFSTADGTRTDIPLNFTMEGSIATADSDVFFENGKLMCILETDGLTQLQRMDLHTGQKDLCLDIPEMSQKKSNYSKDTDFLCTSDAYTWVLRDESICIIDLQTGEIRQILSGITEKPVYAWNDSRSELAVTTGNELLLATPDGSITLRVDLADKKGISVFFFDGYILVLCNDGAVYRYDNQGNLLSKTPLDLYDTFYSNVSGNNGNSTDIHWWRTDDGDLIVKAVQAGNIIDCSRWQSRAFVPYLYAYLPRYDELICFADSQFYAYSRYTTEQQMRKAQEALGDFRLSEDQLKFYGLS